MSSGNPFRASQLYKQVGSAPVPQLPYISTDGGVSEARRGDTDYVLEDGVSPSPPKTKKQVRIVSPTTSIPPHPEAYDVYGSRHGPPARRLDQSQDADSPPPVASAGVTNTPAIESNAASQDAYRANDMAATEALRSSRPYSNPSQSTLSPSGVPPNPFARTLASLEPQETASAADRTGAESTTPGSTKAALDVESFKNLLLTGTPTPHHSAQPSQPPIAPNALGGTLFESSSSTDTSSVSRQSLFEPPQEVHTESPRTSYEMAESEEDENMGLVSEVKKGKKKPPPAPKHRYGKLVTPRQPQVVSFDSFAATEPAPASAPATRSRDNSDVNKPLPPTPSVQSPAVHISTQDTTSSSQPPSIPSRADEPILAADGLAVQKRTPPPVPLARRQSQLRTSTTTNRSRSNSSLTMTSQHSVDQHPSLSSSNQDSQPIAKSPPPPPPSRHGARLANISTSSATSSNAEVPRRSGSVRTAVSAQGPMSSRRSTLGSEPASPVQDINRTPSISSTRNTQRAVSGESTGSLPPPPPPPRRRQSNRSSLDQQRPNVPFSSSPAESRRTSMEYRRTSLDSKRRTSVASESSLRREYAPVEERTGTEYALYSPKEESENTLASAGAPSTETRSDSTSILDDMEKFQREIDELRNRYR